MSLPTWEKVGWRCLFDIYGPLDWKRLDLLFGRAYQYTAGDAVTPLDKFVLFRDISEQPTRQEQEAALLAALGYREE